MRINRFWSETIGLGLAIVPVEVKCDWFCADPIFAGLANYGEDDASHGRSYRNTAHTCYPWHIRGPASRRRTTIVLPSRYSDPLAVVVHEIGHVVDYTLGFEREMQPVTWYAETDREEAFAEAFTAWLLPGYGEQPLAPDDFAWLEATL